MKKPSPTTKREQRARISLNTAQIHALEKIGRSESEYVIGIDEVGIGALAGPIVVGGVVVPKSWSDPAVKDSKLLSFKQRSVALQQVIYEHNFPTCILFRHSTDIDADGVAKTLEQLTEGVALYFRRRFPDAIVVLDGDRGMPIDGSTKNVVWLPKADVHVPAVSAASILAKVSRDEYMIKQHEVYPYWGFNHNMGYPSKQHREAIAVRGISPIHRQSYSTIRRSLAGGR